MQAYTWVKRATAKAKADMQEIVDSYNELAHEDAEVHQYVPYYRLERTSDSWVMVAYVDYAVEGFEDEYKHGDRRYAIGFVRCGYCGAIRELADGQGEFCIECDADWTKPVCQHKAKMLWDEYRKNWTFMTHKEARSFRNRVKRLARQVSLDDAPTVMYLDNLALLLGMDLEYA